MHLLLYKKNPSSSNRQTSSIPACKPHKDRVCVKTEEFAYDMCTKVYQKNIYIHIHTMWIMRCLHMVWRMLCVLVSQNKKTCVTKVSNWVPMRHSHMYSPRLEQKAPFRARDVFTSWSVESVTFTLANVITVLSTRADFRFQTDGSKTLGETTWNHLDQISFLWWKMFVFANEPG